MKKNRLPEKVMFGVGLLMVLTTAFSYIFDWKITSPALGIIGLVLVGVGRKVAYK